MAAGEGLEPAGGEGRRLADHPIRGLRPQRPLDADPVVPARGLERKVERAHRRRPRVVGVVAAHIADVGRPCGARRVLGRCLEADQDGLALAREHAGVVALHPPEVRQIENVVRGADDEGVELVLRHERAYAIELLVVSGPAHQRTRGGAGSPCPSAHEITGFRSVPILSISASITSPGLEVERGGVGAEPGHARHRSRREHVARAVPERRVMAEDLRDRHRHAARVGDLAVDAVHAKRHREVVRIGDLVGSHDPRPERAERVDGLAEREDTGLHLAALDVARGDVVEDHVAADVVHRLLGPEPLPRLAQDHGELELVVELLGEVLGIDHRLVRADDRVGVLEEDDPRCNRVRPVDLLRLVLVLAEVAGRVEELLRDDRGTQARLDERRALGGIVGPAPLEVRAHVRDVEADDLLPLDPAHRPLVVGDELQTTPQTRMAVRA